MSKKRALITGITGQDGSYLAELLLEKGYEVIGMARRVSNTEYPRIAHLKDKITLVYGDLLDQTSLNSLIVEYLPDEVYNLAAQSFVKSSFQLPTYTIDVDGLGAVRLLEAIRLYSPRSKFYQASSSEMFGNALTTPQNEETPFNPASPYGLAKVLAHMTVKYYRETYGMYACSGICFNHESPRRGSEFVTKKICENASLIKTDPNHKFTLGNIDAKRDWGYAKDYVEAMWLMLQQEKPKDYVIATNQTHSVLEFLDEVFKIIGIDDWTPYVSYNSENTRPQDVQILKGDSSKIQKELGWKPTTSFEDLIKLMMDAELKKNA